jgi:hypothetical protein
MLRPCIKAVVTLSVIMSNASPVEINRLASLPVSKLPVV